MSNYTFRPVKDTDAAAVVDIFNYYVANSMAAYPSTLMELSFLSRMRAYSGRLPFFVAVSPDSKVVGFGLLHPIHLADTMRSSAEVTLFLHPDHTKMGVGTELLQLLEEKGRELGVKTIIGGASSHNTQSLEFQRKNGFSECGRFRKVGRKFEKEFDIIWMQKFI